MTALPGYFETRITTVTIPAGTTATVAPPNPNRVWIGFYQGSAAVGVAELLPGGGDTATIGIPIGASAMLEFWYGRHGDWVMAEWFGKDPGGFGVDIRVIELLQIPGVT